MNKGKEKITFITVDGKKHTGFVKDVDSNVMVIDCETCDKECFVEG